MMQLDNRPDISNLLRGISVFYPVRGRRPPQRQRSLCTRSRWWRL